MTTTENAVKTKQLIPLGQVLGTPSSAKLPREEVVLGLMKHSRGMWGDMCEEDKSTNDKALVNGDRLVSAYHTADGTRFYIITEADRSVTTVLLPSEY